jgi:hypothetical protein
MTDRNSKTSFTDLEHICKTRCFIVVIGLIGVNTRAGNDVLVCNVFHRYVMGVSYYIRPCRGHFRAGKIAFRDRLELIYQSLIEAKRIPPAKVFVHLRIFNHESSHLGVRMRFSIST